MEGFDGWQFLAGIGVFLWGMQQLEAALSALGSHSFKRFLRRHTQHPVQAILGGALATAVLQSSSVVGLIILAFVGAGILQLHNAVGVILGANLGTTVTGWLVAMLGFKLDFNHIYLPLLATGAAGVMLLHREYRPYQGALLVFALGFVLMGLGLMKASIATLPLTPAQLAGHNLLVYFLVGALFTAVVQSSSATTVIVLSALHTGLIDLSSGAAIAVGANVGTTATVLLGGLRGSALKRQTAFAHLLFNAITAVVALLLLPLLLALITGGLGITDPLYALVTFHSLFNLLGIALFLPVLHPFTRLLQRLVRENRRHPTRFIHNVPAEITTAALDALELETQRLLHWVMALNLHCFKLPRPALLRGMTADMPLGYADGYQTLKAVEAAIIDYVIRMQSQELDSTTTGRINQLLQVVREATYAAKSIKDIRQDLVDFRHSADPRLHRQEQQLRKAVRLLFDAQLAVLRLRQRSLQLERLAAIGRGVQRLYHQVQMRLLRQPPSPAAEVAPSSLLNLNRELLLANTAMGKALAHFLLPSEDVDALFSTQGH